jgi:hypothetical protein
MDRGQEIPRRLVVTSRNRPELFELTKEILNPMACFVQLTTIGAWLFAVGPGRNHGRLARLRQRLKHSLLGIVAFIGKDDRSRERRQQHIGSVQVAGLSECQQKAGRVAAGIDSGVDLGAQPAFAAPDRLVPAVFFFAPALC